jgi:hypothetical protein
MCPLVLLVKDLINFEFKDVGAGVREREKKVGGGSERHYRLEGGCNRNRGNTLLLRYTFKNSVRKHTTSLLHI